MWQGDVNTTACQLVIFIFGLMELKRILKGLFLYFLRRLMCHGARSRAPLLLRMGGLHAVFTSCIAIARAWKRLSQCTWVQRHTRKASLEACHPLQRAPAFAANTHGLRTELLIAHSLCTPTTNKKLLDAGNPPLHLY